MVKVGSALLAALAVGLLGAAGASACPCRDFCGAVVDHGTSPHGVPWRITAATRSPHRHPYVPSSADVDFKVGACGEGTEAGYAIGFKLPIHSRSFLTSGFGSQIDAYPENDLSGIAAGAVAELVVTLTDGSALRIHPDPAPRRLRKRLPWLRHLRFFDAFFESGRRPKEAAIFDRAGDLLARRQARYGGFHWPGRWGFS